MSVSGISSASSNVGLLKLYQQRNQDLASLESAVQSGNVTAAQQSLTTLEQDTQNIHSSLDPTSAAAAGSSPPSGFASDLAALLQAVQSGDAASAQQDASAVEKDLQNATSPASGTHPKSGHHHHHHTAQSEDSTAGSSNSTTDSTAASSTSLTDPASDPGSDTSTNDTISLIQILYMSN